MHIVKKQFKHLAPYMIFIALIVVMAIIVSLIIEPTIALYGKIAGSAIEYSADGEDITADVINNTEKTLLMQNDMLNFYMTADCGVVVEDKRNGGVWQSFVPDDKNGNYEGNIELQKSLLSLIYLNERDNPTAMYSYDGCVEKNQFKILKLNDNTIRVDMMIGELVESLLIPTAIEKTRFEKEIITKLSEDDRNFLKRRYILYSAETMTEADNPTEKFKLYPELKNKDFYILSSVNGKVIRERTQEMFENMGYTAEDLAADNAESGYSVESSAPLFKVAMDFSIENGTLLVNIPKEETSFYRDYPLLNLQPLPNFISASDSNGSMFVPSGSGAIIDFGEGQDTRKYSAPFYGTDSTVVHKETPVAMSSDSDDLSFPMYAMNNSGKTVMAIIEKGAASAELVIERRTKSALMYADFTIIQNGNVYISPTKKSLVCAKDVNSESIAIRYSFISAGEDSLNYSLLAANYRDYLKANKALPSDAQESTVLLLNLVGGVTLPDEFLKMFPTEKVESLSTFEEMEDMVKPFIKDNRTIVKISGWNKNGLLSQAPGTFKVNGKLGGKKGLEDLLETFDSNGIRTVIDFNHAYYYNPSFADGFNESKNAAILIDKDTALINGYDTVNGDYSEDIAGSLIISPARYTNIVKKYIEKGYNSIAIGRLAQSLNSDYNRDNYIDRSKACKETVKALSEYKKSGIYLTAVNANDYALPFVSLIEEMPTSAGNGGIISRSIPFKQMVLHGSIDYTVESVNQSENMNTALLKAIETGSGLSYTFIKNMYNDILETPYNYLYYSEYSRTYKDALKACAEVNSALDGLGKETIIEHTNNLGISKTVYSGGTVIYVNYNDKPAEIDGIKIEPITWKRVG